MSSLSTDLQNWIRQHEEEFIEDIKTIVSIKSVSAFDASAQYPFGSGCKQVLDRMLALCKEAGLETRNYDDYCGTAVLPGETEETIGLLVHLDVVPEGEGWSTAPYELVVKDGYIYGRGTSDDKGPAIMALYLLKFLKQRNIKLKHSILLFLGCNEESGMKDIEYFITKEKQPVFSITPDSSFPVSHGEKGLLEGNLICDLSGGIIQDFRGGIVSNSVPDSAFAVLKTDEAQRIVEKLKDKDCLVEALEGEVRVSTKGIAGHAAYPENSLNAIWKLADILANANVLDTHTQDKMQFIANAFAHYDGSYFGIDFQDEQSGKTTMIGGMVRVEDGKLIQNFNIRYVVSANADTIVENLRKTSEKSGFALDIRRIDPPCFIDKNDPVITTLTAISNERLGINLEPHVMGGGTYARKLKRAVAFGPGRSDVPRLGSAHQVDECVLIEDLFAGMEIYTESLLALDKIL